jgi:hypothetical protein
MIRIDWMPAHRPHRHYIWKVSADPGLFATSPGEGSQVRFTTATIHPRTLYGTKSSIIVLDRRPWGFTVECGQTTGGQL